MKAHREKGTKADELKEKREKQKTGEMSFLEHLEELRWHIIRSFAAVVILAILAFIFKDFIFEEIIMKPKTPGFFTNRLFAKMSDLLGSEALEINRKELQLINITMSGQFSMSMWVSLVAGLILGAPVLFLEFWKFVKPALYDKEKRVASKAVIYTTLLFTMGILFGYYLILPLSIEFFSSYSISGEVTNQININSYISMVSSIILASGLIFLLPVLTYSLSKVGIISPEFMKTYRRHAYILLLLLSAIITPPDVFSQILVAIPLIILYEASIFISRRVAKTLEKESDA